MGHIATLREIRFWRIAKAVGYVVGGAAVIWVGLVFISGSGPEVVSCVLG